MKKMAILMATLSFFLIFGLNTPASAEVKFTDVPSNHWAIAEIDFLSSLEVIKGYSNGKCGPNDNIKRSDAAVMIARALMLDLNNRPNPNFKDVPKNHKSIKEISAVVDEGIFPRTETFNPDSKMTRGDMARALVKAYGLTGDYKQEFTDVPKNHYAYEFISTLAANHITQGYGNGKFGPDEPVQRAQFAVFFARVIDESFKPTYSGINSRKLENELYERFPKIKIGKNEYLPTYRVTYNELDEYPFYVYIELTNEVYEKFSKVSNLANYDYIFIHMEKTLDYLSVTYPDIISIVQVNLDDYYEGIPSEFNDDYQYQEVFEYENGVFEIYRPMFIMDNSEEDYYIPYIYDPILEKVYFNE